MLECDTVKVNVTPTIVGASELGRGRGPVCESAVCDYCCRWEGRCSVW